MAYTLLTSGLATNLIHLIGVESGIVKDFKAAATISSTTGCTISAAQWRSATSNSSSHEYVQTDSTTGLVTFGTKPTFSLGGTRAIFIAMQGAGVNFFNPNNASAMFGSTTTSKIGSTGYGVTYANFASDNARINSTTNGSDWYNKTTTQIAWGFTSNGTTSGDYKAYYAEATGAMTDVTGTVATNATAQTFQPAYIGAQDGPSSAVTARYFIVAQFDKTLSAEEFEALNTDWFGTLFESGTSVAPLAMGAYSRMRNG